MKIAALLFIFGMLFVAATARAQDGAASEKGAVSSTDPGYMVGNPASHGQGYRGSARPYRTNPASGQIGAPLRPGDLGYGPDPEKVR